MNNHQAQEIKFYHTIQLGDKIWMIGSWITDSKLAMSMLKNNTINWLSLPKQSEHRVMGI